MGACYVSILKGRQCQPYQPKPSSQSQWLIGQESLISKKQDQTFTGKRMEGAKIKKDL